MRILFIGWAYYFFPQDNRRPLSQQHRNINIEFINSVRRFGEKFFQILSGGVLKIHLNYRPFRPSTPISYNLAGYVDVQFPISGLRNNSSGRIKAPCFVQRPVINMLVEIQAVDKY